MSWKVIECLSFTSLISSSEEGDEEQQHEEEEEEAEEFQSAEEYSAYLDKLERK